MIDGDDNDDDDGREKNVPHPVDLVAPLLRWPEPCPHTERLHGHRVVWLLLSDEGQGYSTRVVVVVEENLNLMEPGLECS